MASRFMLQIIDRASGDVIQFEPGRSIEMAFVTDCVKRIVEQLRNSEFVATCTENTAKRGIGICVSTKRVSKHISDGVNESLVNVGSLVRVGIEAAILELKGRVKTNR